MRKGLAIYTVMLLLAATFIPLASAQDGNGSGITPELGDDLSAFGRGYVENLVLYSGAGVGLAWGPSFDGNGTALADRLSELEGASGDSMPVGATPVMLPFKQADPGFAGPAPLDHSEAWTWNSTGQLAIVEDRGLGATLKAEAAYVMDGDLGATELLLVLMATEAVQFTADHLGGNGTALIALNASDPNMTDMDMDNGYWLPYHSVEGELNDSYDPPAWEDLRVRDAVYFVSAIELLDGVGAVYHMLGSKSGLVGAGEPFPPETKDAVEAVHSALYWNVVGYYQDPAMWGAGGHSTAELAMLYLVLEGVAAARGPDPVGIHAKGMLQEIGPDLLSLQRVDGSVSGEYQPLPEGGVSPTMDTGSGMVHALMVEALYKAQGRFGGVAYSAAARACLAYMDAEFWDPNHHLVFDDPDMPTMAVSLSEAWAMRAYATAAGMGVQIANYRVAETWDGIVGAGLQLSETDATGENYTAVGNDTDGDGINKHDVAAGPGRAHGVAPVLAERSEYTDGNWTVEDGGKVFAYHLMTSAAVMMGMDGDWATSVGGPEVSQVYAHRLLHWTDQDWVDWMDSRDAVIADLHDQITDLMNQSGNVSQIIEELEEEIADLEDQLAALQLDYNDTHENETILRNQVEWLREKLEETNETVDDLEKKVEVLESKVERIEADLEEMDENVTDLEVKLRNERNNVTKLKWELENASAAVDQAELDLDAAIKERDDTQEKLDEQESRSFITALIALFVGMIIVIIVMRVTGKI